MQEFKEYKCNECGKVFRREATLRRHLDIDHDTTWAEIEKEYVMDQDEDEDEPEKQGTEEGGLLRYCEKEDCLGFICKICLLS